MLKKLLAPLLLMLLSIPAYAIDIGRIPDGAAYDAARGSTNVIQSGRTQYFPAAAANVQVTSVTSTVVGFYGQNGTSASVTLYDDGDGTCNGNQLTPTVSIATGGTTWMLPLEFSTAVCAAVVGAPNLTFVTQP